MEESKRATPENTSWIEYSITESGKDGPQLRSGNLPREQAKALVHHINKTNPHIGATSRPVNTKVGADHIVYIKDALEFKDTFRVADIKWKGHADSHLRSGPKARSHKSGGQLQPTVHLR